jgi:outer membrane lipoprotein-sorting protein
MKISVLSFLAVFLVSVLNQSQAQNIQSVLDNHFKAVGQEKLLEMESYSIKATVKQMGMEIPMNMKTKRPNKFRMEMEMMGQKMVQTYDGEKGWVLAPWVSSEPQELTGPELSQAIDQANIDGELYNYSEKGTTGELIGKVNMEGTPVFNIRLTDKEGTVKNYFIDAETWLVRKIRAKINAQGQEVEVEQSLADYKNIDGVMMPSKIESKTPMGTVEIVFDEIKFNEKFDDSVFSKP